MESKRFGQAYKKYRQARGYSLKEAAGQTVSPQFLGQFERGEKGISLDTLDQLLDNIGLTWSDFLTEDGSQPEPDQTSPRMAQKGLFPADVQFLTAQGPCQPNPEKILNRLLQTQFFTHLELDFLASQVRTLPLSFFLKSGGRLQSPSSPIDRCSE